MVHTTDARYILYCLARPVVIPVFLAHALLVNSALLLWFIQPAELKLDQSAKGAGHFLLVLVRSISASMARRRIAFIRVW